MEASPQAVDDFIASLPDGGGRWSGRWTGDQGGRTRSRRADGQVIGYGSYHYRYASGREGNWFPIGLANNKQYVSLYICAADDDGYLAEANAGRLGKVSVGKSCIRFKRLEDLDLEVAVELSRRAAELVKAGRFAM